MKKNCENGTGAFAWYVFAYAKICAVCICIGPMRHARNGIMKWILNFHSRLKCCIWKYNKNEIKFSILMADDADVKRNCERKKSGSAPQSTHWINKFLIFHGSLYAVPMWIYLCKRHPIATQLRKNAWMRWRRLFICHMCVVSTVSGVLFVSTILRALRIQPIFPVIFFYFKNPIGSCACMWTKIGCGKKLINLGLRFLQRFLFCSPP